MLFTSGQFLFLFLPIVVVAFFAIAKVAGRSAAAAWLVLASLFFYASWRPEYLVLLIGSIAFNYALGSLIQRHCTTDRRKAKTFLIIAITANLAALGYFKYANFFINTAEALFDAPLVDLAVVLPIGISFFTFTQIAYLADSYAGKVRERNPVHYALFVTYFPHLISGPVLHHAEMMPQFRDPKTYVPHLRNLVIGMSFLAVGLAKKALLADTAAPFANDVFNAASPAALASGTVWQGVLAYTLQIYFDFSGYSDMAVGLSLLIGVRLPYNFNSPYKARDISDFWRRWHMTLSRFLRDYLYVPLGGNRRGPGRRYVNLAATMLLGGLWHGASWTFVVWGGLHGFYLIVNHLWRHVTAGVAGARPAAQRGALRWLSALAGNALTLLAVAVAWVFFRATTFGQAATILKGMIGLNAAPSGSSAGADVGVWLWLAVGFLIVLIPRNSQDLIDGALASVLAKVDRARAGDVLQGALIGLSVVTGTMLALISASREITEFIYFNF
jgi:D-alanyl-lipoteichoic acid acyltransferase DltB (MBOAT superfamily)